MVHTIIPRAGCDPPSPASSKNIGLNGSRTESQNDGCHPRACPEDPSSSDAEVKWILGMKPTMTPSRLLPTLPERGEFHIREPFGLVLQHPRAFGEKHERPIAISRDLSAMRIDELLKLRRIVG